MNPDRVLASSPAAAADDRAAARGVRAALYVAVGLLTVSPLFWVRVPALVDYPNHLARMWILARHGSVPALDANYLVDWRILPDLAMDLIVPPLAKFMPLESAGRVFIGMTMLALLFGTATLHRVLHGRWGIWPLSSSLFVYDLVLFRGFLNCLFGIGACLFAISGWIASREWKAGWRILVFSAVACALFLFHLFAFGLYGLFVALYEVGERIRRRRISLSSFLSLVAAGLQFLPGIVLWYVSLKHSGPDLTIFGNITTKLYSLISPFTFGFLPVLLDRLIGLLACAFLVFALATRSLILAPELRIPLIGLAIAAAAMPHVLSGSWAADLRLPVALVFLIIGATRFDSAWPRAAAVFAVAASCLLGLRIWTVTQSWIDYDRQFAEFRSASRVIAPGARLLVVEAPTVTGPSRSLPGVPQQLAVQQTLVFTHMAALAVIDRSAFMPYMFTGWTTIDVTPRNRAIAQQEGVPTTPDELRSAADPALRKELDTGPDIYGERPYWRDWPSRFDYVLWIDFGSRPSRVPRQLRLLKQGSFFAIYRVEGTALPKPQRAP